MNGAPKQDEKEQEICFPGVISPADMDQVWLSLTLGYGPEGSELTQDERLLIAAIDRRWSK